MKRSYSSWKNNAAGLVGAYVGSALKRKYPSVFGARKKRRMPVKPRYQKRKRIPTDLEYRRKRHQTPVVKEEYQKERVQLGRKVKKNLKGAWKHIKNNLNESRQSIRSYVEFGSSNGFNFLQNVAASAADPWTPPMILYDLTSCRNVVGGVVTDYNPCWKPEFSNYGAAGNLTWVQPATSGNWLPEDTPAASTTAASYPQDKSVLDWVSAKLLFYSPFNIPTRISVQIVQFTDRRFCPGESTGAADPLVNAFYQGLIKKYSYSPLEEGNSNLKKWMKVLYSKDFIMEPKDTDEQVPAQYKQLDIFNRMNRVCKYDWNQNDAMNVMSVDTQVNNSRNLNVVEPKARIYLMIRAQSKLNSVISNAVHPSFDIVLRTKHTQFNI